ncbi:MAG: TetR/AcrR family transcriptional regulator [Bacteroidetes bacterium]|uniref:TetR/AcrR family transcriptional regulator n=1 Tax=Candidatus Limisoma faecipullorum TaxID=2840854 RepID=A0A9D9NJB1_9BACT|nr:TetR/AcrR family transcriptional regulator [Candidatus Limisoma faecipullorum]
MQCKKDDIRKSILHEVRNSFLKKGFRNTSMHVIALESGTGLCNIYNYYSGKDEINK